MKLDLKPQIKMEPESKRRYTTRTYKGATLLLHDMFKIPIQKERITDLEFNKSENKIRIKSILYLDTKAGDV